jgi:DNA-binding NarL/FixJ family response regulator
MTTTSAPSSAGLTPREDQVLELIGRGLTNREIGNHLGIAEKTVKNTVTVVLAKLGLQRRSQAAIYVTVRRVTGGDVTWAAGSPGLIAG